MAGNSNFDALLTTTLANYRDQLTDNIFTARPLTYMLNEKGRIRMLNGGTKIVEYHQHIRLLVIIFFVGLYGCTFRILFHPYSIFCLGGRFLFHSEHST